MATLVIPRSCQILGLLCTCVFGLLPRSSEGQLLTFETLPDGSPVEDRMVISNQYNVPPYFVSFELIGQPPTMGPRIAKGGKSQDGIRWAGAGRQRVLPQLN